VKKFKYRLQPLLNVKSHIERERQKDHALAVERIMRQEEQLSQVDAQRESTLIEQRAGLLGSISITKMLVYSRYLLKLKKNTLAGIETLRGLKKNAEEKRSVLVEASKERKIYEKLKERQQDRYNTESARQEQKETDEIAITGYGGGGLSLGE
jgi:flagellar FliJ protein